MGPRIPSTTRAKTSTSTWLAPARSSARAQASIVAPEVSGAPAAPMIAFITRLFARGEPQLSEAVLSDARDLAELHAACFRRGWSDEEFARLLLEATVVTHRAMIAKSIAGFSFRTEPSA